MEKTKQNKKTQPATGPEIIPRGTMEHLKDREGDFSAANGQFGARPAVLHCHKSNIVNILYALLDRSKQVKQSSLIALCDARLIFFLYPFGFWPEVNEVA